MKGIDETLDYIIEHKPSLVRFGDGEINMLAGDSIPYQDYDEELVSIMRDIIGQESREELVVCLPDAFTDRLVYIVGDSILERSYGSLYGFLQRIM